MNNSSFLTGVNIMIFNQQIFDHDMSSLISSANEIMSNTYFTFLLNPFSDNALELVDKSIALGIKSFKFHSYVQI